MGVEWKKARIGYKWALTELGLEITRVRNKYEKNYEHRKEYEQKVPVTWVEAGYVREVQRFVEREGE